MRTEPRHWTEGPARFVAAGVLGAASIIGLFWSIGWRAPAPRGTTPGHDPAIAAVEKPARSTGSTLESGRRASRPAVASGRIDINRASAAELELLPRIGPTLSKRIVAFREKNGPFRTIDALDRVKGIGPKTIERLRPLVSIGERAGGGD